MRIPKWQKIMMVILGLLTALMVCFDATLYRAFFYNPDHITTRYEQIRDPSIPKSMSQVSIVFLTDIEYSQPDFSNEKAEALFAQVRKLNPDVLLIGGDLFAWNCEVSDTLQDRMANWLSSIPTPLGKFAVFGEQDLVDEAHQHAVEDVYRRSQIELINNASILLANQSAEGIRLGGLNVSADPNALIPAFVPEQFCLLLSHYPDNLLQASNAGLNADYALAGNSHGTQINWPIFGGYKEFDGSLQIDRDKQKRLSFGYTISSGIGCIDVQARLNAPVEILYLTLYNPQA